MDDPIVEFDDWNRVLRESVPVGPAGGLPGSGGEVPLLAAGKRETAERGRVQGASGMEEIVSAHKTI